MGGSDDQSEIETLAQDYFDALYFGKAEVFQRVFHPDARLYTVNGGAFTTLDVPTYLGIVANRAAPSATSEKRDDRILSLVQPTPITAHLRTSERFFTKIFTDELTLLKVDGRWQIVSKVWDFELAG